MPIIVTPYIPTYITVHLGLPGSNAENVTVPFPEYIKNVASSEVYPTWQPAALRANILAQVSYALNRVYTEFYPAQGYDFNITSTTAYDQRFIKGRNIFENISALVDDLFNVYIRRQGFAEPLAAKFCNGTTTTCDGLSQWGSEHLAQEGYNSVEILRNYYGDNIELVSNAPMQNIQASYPGIPVRMGDVGPEVRFVQFTLNRISQSYPAIPKLPQVDGVFGQATYDAVRTFQKIFQLAVDGVVGKSTWYMLVRLYTGILQLSELVSQGQTEFQVNFDYANAISYGDRGERVSLLQYLLSILSQFYLSIPFVTIDGIFGDETRRAVEALQQDAGLRETGVVDERTWNTLVSRFMGISETVLDQDTLFPLAGLSPDEITQEQLQYALSSQLEQYPGYTLSYGQRDQEGGGAR